MTWMSDLSLPHYRLVFDTKLPLLPVAKPWRRCTRHLRTVIFSSRFLIESNGFLASHSLIFSHCRGKPDSAQVSPLPANRLIAATAFWCFPRVTTPPMASCAPFVRE